jgi:SAM-dependent methyltransferase
MFWALDALFGTFLGVLVVGFHEFLIPNSWPLWWSFLAAMSIVMVLQSLISYFIGNLIGSMEAMIPGGFIGMGAMIAAYLPLPSRYLMVVFGAMSGLVISMVFVILDIQLRRTTFQVSAFRRSGGKLSSPSYILRKPSWLYDLQEMAGARRRAFAQKALFANMGDSVLFVAAGSGLNFANFPPRRNIIAIDVNVEALGRAQGRAESYDGNLRLMEADVQKLPFEDASFDTIATASTFCSVPNPDRGLSELRRVLKPGGKLLMLEHVRSRNPLIALEQDMMNLAMRFLGSDVNRDTVGAVRNAGFVIDQIRSAYLDVFLMIDGHRPSMREDQAAFTRNA